MIFFFRGKLRRKEKEKRGVEKKEQTFILCFIFGREGQIRLDEEMRAPPPNGRSRDL